MPALCAAVFPRLRSSGTSRVCSSGNLQHRKRTVAPGHERRVRIRRECANKNWEMNEKRKNIWVPAHVLHQRHQRRRYDFSLPWAKRWRRLLPMPNAGTVQERIAAPDPGWVAPPAPRLRSSCASAGPGRDTLHFNLDVAGSAAQFNRSVSAMPANPARTFPRPPRQGTADTLSKGSA